jgi:hypothetical protein
MFCKKCDKCGKIIDDVATRAYRLLSKGELETIHFCDVCSPIFDEWLEKK